MMTKTARNWLGGLAVAATIATSAPAFAQRDPGAPGPVMGRITMVARGVALGVGYTSGSGTLTYGRHRYPFSVRGVTVADVGFSRVVGRGRVYNLHRLADFSGTYAAASGEATLGTGLGGQILKNGQGVEIRIDDVTRGARLAGSADGIQLELHH